MDENKNNPAKKARKKPNVRTEADLKNEGVKGNILVVARKAFALGNQNKYAGTVQAGKDYPATSLYTKGKVDGSFWKLPEDGEAFKKVHSAAKNAVNDINKLSYTQSVKNMIDAWSGIPKMGGGGGRTLGTDSLVGIKL